MYLSLSVPSDRIDVFRAAAAALLAAAAIISLILLISPVQELEAEINSFRLSGGGPAARSSAASAADPTPTPSPTVAVLSAPVLTAQAAEDGVELSWTTMHGATRYELFVWDSVNDWRQIGGDSLTGTTYTYTDLVAGTTYFYTIRAVNADGETSAWSDYVSTATAIPAHTPTATATPTHTPTATAATATHTPTATTGQPSDSSQNDVTVKDDSGNEGNVSPGQTSEDKTRIGPRQGVTGPTVTITGGDGIVVVGGDNQVNGASFDVTITFSENVGATFDHTDITVTNAQSLTATDVNASTAGLIYTATIRPTAGFSGAVTVQVPAAAAQNASNEGNQASNVLSATATMQSACVTGGAVPAGDEYADLARDCATLLGLHDELVGSATLSPAWSVSTPILTWQGISLEAMRVSHLLLEQQGLTGSLPAALGDLDGLTQLSLLDNTLTGEIPSELGGLSKLRDLLLSSNSLNSVIPSEIGELSELRYLALGSNVLTGTIPVTLGQLAKLEVLDLSRSALTGTIPMEIGSLLELYSLNLAMNTLQGPIPDELGDLLSLVQLEMGDNQFASAIPATLSQLSELGILDLRNAGLTGSLPNLGLMTSLRIVDLNDNQFTGTIPDLSDLVNLSTLDVSFNELSGGIPNFHVLNPVFKSFIAENNRFTGTIPGALTQLSSLDALILTSNQLTGSVPDFSGMMNLRIVILDRNQLSGTVAPVSNLPNLEQYAVHRNKLTGPIPTMITVPKLWLAYFHCNQFSGEIPASYDEITSLQRLLFFDNQLTGEIPDLSALGSLEWLWLNHNHLEGNIPDTVSAKLPVSNNPLLWVTLNGNLFEGVDRDSGAIDGSPTGLTVTRRDPCTPRAGFNARNFSVTEGDVVTVTVELALAAVEAVTIPIAVTHNDGASAADYSLEPASSSLTFDIGEVSKTFTITATDDSDNDDGESLTLRFGTLPAGVSAGSPATATVNITDNDVPTVPTVTIAGAEGIVVVGGDNQVNGASFDVTITFSESVGATFDHTEITVTNAQSLAATDFITSTSGLIYTATIRPTAGFSGTVSVQVPADAAQNASNEGNQASNVLSATATMQSACVTGGAVPLGDEYADLARDCATLLGLHDELVGSATLSPAWSVSTPIATWLGITIEARRVTRILLGAKSLTGVIPPELGDLERLTYLSLRENELTGEIPHELGSLERLNTLILSDNLLGGEIPPALGDLSLLLHLFLNSNQLSGAIPGELGALEELATLHLQTNLLTGTIPMQLGSLAQLTDLSLGFNQLSGPIPDTLGNLSGLVILSLRNNQFNSPIPSAVTRLTALRNLDMRQAKLNGTIPDALNQIDLLESLDLRGNQLTGPVPDFSGMMNLRNVILSSNQLTGSIPAMTNLPNLNAAWFFCNQFSGEIPASFNNITSLTQLILTDNQLTGEIPDLSALGSLGYLWLNHNHLEGDFSNIASLLAKLPVVSSLSVRLNGNLFAGVDRDSGAIDSPPPWLTVGRGNPCTPRAGFNARNFSVTEGEVVTVTVSLEREVEETVTIPIAVTHNDGASAADYSLEPASSSLTFDIGEVSKTFTITATDDSDNDDGESLTLRFGTLPDGVNVGSPATATVNITDDDGPAVTVRYEQASYTVGEGSSVVIKVKLSADPDRTVTIPISKTNQGGATDADYSGVPANASVTFNSGDTEKRITFTATNDSVDDDGESVLLGFGTLPTRVSAGSPATATVNITDNDVRAVMVRYEQASYTVGEGSSVVIKVILSADPERRVTISINRANQGGATTDDYSVVPTSLTFNSGETIKSITFAATDDSVNDDGESVRLGFGTLPTGVSRGTHRGATVNITDNDTGQPLNTVCGGPVSNLKGVGTSETRVLFTWGPPAGGCRLQAYIVEFSAGNGPECGAGGSSSFDWTGSVKRVLRLPGSGIILTIWGDQTNGPLDKPHEGDRRHLRVKSVFVDSSESAAFSGGVCAKVLSEENE